jgi:lipopolysaccharide transport system permease protein
MTLSHYFRLVDLQARMGLKADASRLVLGYVWWVLEPLLYVFVFYLVFDVIMDAGRSDFLVFLMCGKLPFIWFSRSLNQSAGSIVSNAGIIGRIDVPKSMFPMVLVQQNFYRQCPVFALLLLVLLVAGYYPDLGWLWVVPVVLVQYLLIVACSLIGAVLVCYIQDFTMVISLATVFLMFTSGIFWDIRAVQDPQLVELILVLNPLAFLLDAYRQVLMYGQAPDGSHLALLGAACLVVVYLVVRYTRWASQALALRALS